MSDAEIIERVVRLETQMENLPGAVQRVEDRLRKLEWIAACGIGALGLLQFILTKWS